MTVSASALRRHCGHPRQISREQPKSARVQAAADLGTAFHAAVAKWAETGALPPPDACGGDEVRGWLELLAMQWSPPPRAMLEHAMGLSPSGRYVDVVEDPPDSHQYVAVDHDAEGPYPLLTAGRADVVWRDGGMEPGEVLRDIATVLDFKTGRYAVEAPATNLQLAALGFAAADMFGSGHMRLGIYYARDGVFEWSDVIELDGDHAAALWADVEDAALLDETPRPGEHCGPCWERRMGRCSFAQQTER